MSFFPTTKDQWTLWITSFVLTILFIAASYFGSRLPWYQALKRDDNYWLLAGLWIVASLLSYGAFYLITDRRLLPLFVLVGYLNILWIVLFYILEQFSWSLFFIAVIIILNLYIIVFLWQLNIWAAVLVIPLEILYLYLFYSIIHLGINNNITS